MYICISATDMCAARLASQVCYKNVCAYKPCNGRERWALEIMPSLNTVLLGGAEQWGRLGAWLLSRRCCSVCRNVLYRARQLHTLAWGVTADSNCLLGGTAHFHIWSHRHMPTLTETERCSISFRKHVWSSGARGWVMLYCLPKRVPLVPQFVLHPSQDL